MGQKRVETIKEERKIIINLHNHCKSLSEISQIISRLSPVWTKEQTTK